MSDKALPYNPQTHQMELKPVLHVWINHDNDLVDLTLTTTGPARHGKPAARTSEVIHTNQKHPFFTKEKGFLPVGQIKLGMHVLRADGTYGVVTGWKRVPGTSVMYNLEVAQDHTFTVGDGQWVVHNSCYDQAEEALNLLTARRAAGENVSAVATSNVIDAQGNRITDIINSSPGETMIGTTPAKTNLWGGCCAETHIAAKIADALANGGSVDGENIQIGLAHIQGLSPCRNCIDNIYALARLPGINQEIDVSFFVLYGYDVWTFSP